MFKSVHVIDKLNQVSLLYKFHVANNYSKLYVGMHYNNSA